MTIFSPIEHLGESIHHQLETFAGLVVGICANAFGRERFFVSQLGIEDRVECASVDQLRDKLSIKPKRPLSLVVYPEDCMGMCHPDTLLALYPFMCDCSRILIARNMEIPGIIGTYSGARTWYLDEPFLWDNSDSSENFIIGFKNRVQQSGLILDQFSDDIHSVAVIDLRTSYRILGINARRIWIDVAIANGTIECNIFRREMESWIRTERVPLKEASDHIQAVYLHQVIASVWDLKQSIRNLTVWLPGTCEIGIAFSNAASNEKIGAIIGDDVKTASTHGTRRHTVKSVERNLFQNGFVSRISIPKISERTFFDPATRLQFLDSVSKYSRFMDTPTMFARHG